MSHARKKFLTALLLVCALVSTAHLTAVHRPGQLALTPATREAAERLRTDILGEMLPVRDTSARVRELSRIPDPRSFLTFERLLLDPRSYPSPVRRAAVEALAEYRGAADEAIAGLLSRAFRSETVREVMWEIARVLESKKVRAPEELRRIAQEDPRPEWRSYSRRALRILDVSQSPLASPAPGGCARRSPRVRIFE